MKTPLTADVEGDEEDEEEDDDREAEGDGDGGGDYVNLDVDKDEDGKLAIRLAEEEVKRVPMKRLRSRSGASSNYRGSDFVQPAYVNEDPLTTSGPEIKRSPPLFVARLYKVIRGLEPPQRPRRDAKTWSKAVTIW